MTSPTGAAPEVSILTPIHNAERTLPRCFQALLTTQHNHRCEIILINDGSTDDSSTLIQAFAAQNPGLVQVLSKDNGGEASALNMGWRAARGRFVAILEADVEAEPDWLTQCLNFLKESPDFIAVGGRLKAPPDDPWIARFHGYDVEAKLLSHSGSVRHLTSANVLYRREAFEIAGPFDERLINASLDAVFNGRLIDAGQRLYHLADARVLHRYKSTLRGYLSRHFAYARYRVYGPRLNLYPADRWLSVQVATCALSFTLFILSALAPLYDLASTSVIAMIAAALAFVAVIPVTLQRFRIHKDPALLLYPSVAYLRNLVGALGYVMGLFEKSFKSK